MTIGELITASGSTVLGKTAGFVPLPEAICGEWYVLHTKSRQEKALANDLSAMDIPHYLPLVPHVRYHGNRKATVMEPLFPGYVFLRGSLDEAYRADRTKRLANVIRVPDQGHLQWELSNLHQALSCQAPLDLYACLKKGVRVEVRSGPLQGLQGVVEDRTRMGRLVLQVRMLGRAVSLEIEPDLLDVIE